MSPTRSHDGLPNHWNLQFTRITLLPEHPRRVLGPLSARTRKLSALTETLREAGHCVFAVQDGRSALELTIQLPSIDLLVTNTRLGVMDDPELIRLVRYMRPKVHILHFVEESDESTPPDVPTLREPFTPTQC